ncbi:hypothetical protein A1F94_013667 [Pyrenophora tritici-repentis]|nr:hypothetical protein A1F94_013667 [Pyrenophora tritici-repentis]
MTAQANQQNATVLLRDEHDYRAWYSQLKRALPLMEPFLRSSGVRRLRAIDWTPAGANPTRLSDLSSAGQRAYKDDLEIYKLKMEQYKTKYARYKTEITNLQHIMILVQSTVAVHLQRTCCPPDGSIRDWIKNLRAHVGITIETEREQARQRYYSALKPPRSANNWDTWLAEYNQAVTEAETLKVPDTTQFRSVAVDFMSAVNKIAPIWAATFQSQWDGSTWGNPEGHDETVPRVYDAESSDHAKQKPKGSFLQWMIHLYFLLRTATLTSAWMGTPTMWKRETLKSENGADPDINVQL